MTVVDLLVTRLAEAGARFIFGVPGGGSNLDVIEAARGRGLRFVLSHTETAGALMAAAQAEITGAPGVCLSTLGPGVSSLVNGVAHAWLDRVPLVVLTDAMSREARDRFEHQNLPHAALLGPITKFTVDLSSRGSDALIAEALAHATALPGGPVHIDCAPEIMAAEVQLDAPSDAPAESRPCATLQPAAQRMLRQARRPLVIVGLGVRGRTDAAAVRSLCERRGLPVLSTYKAKGVVGDGHPLYAGLFTLGRIERPLVESADLLLTVGLDPVELLPRPWPWALPVVHCARWPAGSDQMPAGETIVGDLADVLAQVEDCLPPSSEWAAGTTADHRERHRAAVIAGANGFTPGRAVEAIADVSASARHVTIDAGAHMFPAMALMPADVPGRILISNGLSTMGYALPAAIGAALLAPQEPVVALTGDAGLLMCLGELLTAARERLRVVVVVFADSELSLIRIKQDRRGLDPEGVRIGDLDWPRAAGAFGLRSFRACDEGSLRRHVADALHADGPALVEARIDPSGYGRMLETLRG